MDRFELESLPDGLTGCRDQFNLTGCGGLGAGPRAGDVELGGAVVSGEGLSDLMFD